MYQRVIKPILFSLSIERAYRVVILLLRIIILAIQFQRAYRRLGRRQRIL